MAIDDWRLPIQEQSRNLYQRVIMLHSDILSFILQVKSFTGTTRHITMDQNAEQLKQNHTHESMIWLQSHNNNLSG